MRCATERRCCTWTSLWVRAALVPLAKAEVKSSNHARYVELQRASDGTLTDPAGFGAGQFTPRLTAFDGSVHTDSFEWPNDGVAGALLMGTGDFD